MGKIRFSHIVLLTLVLFSMLPTRTSGQVSPFDPGLSKQASLIKEQVKVLTDRSLYLVNERIQFRADYFISGPGDLKAWSKVLYVELISAAGVSLAQGKYEISENISIGALLIPANVITGSYYLKCYTRWMRNAGPGTFSYTPLKVINPFQKEVEYQESEEAPEAGPTIQPLIRGVIKCELDEKIVERGGDVNVSVTGPVQFSGGDLNGCLTAVFVGAIDTVSGSMEVPKGERVSEEFQVRYLPDRQGPSLSGTIVKTSPENEPSPFTKLHFSLLGNKPDYFATQTDLNGRFVVTTPSGPATQEYFVAPEAWDPEPVEVRIDQDFDVVPGRLPVVQFSLDPEEDIVAHQMSLRMQLAEVYQESILPETIERDTTRPFYGIPVQSLNLADWITLPNLEEVFINLVPNIYVVRRKNKASFRIHGDNTSLPIYSPLILIDHIPVFDQDAVARISPGKIERIDVINEVYVKGNVSYGGLISIWTKKGDMAGIDLPAGSYFFDYQSIESDIPVNKPLGEGDRVPDFRNTFYWNPKILLDQGTTQNISFKAPDLPGKYVILLRAYSQQGELLSAQAIFEVK